MRKNKKIIISSADSKYFNLLSELLFSIKNNNLMDKIKRLSNTYRISKYCFEGERGFLSKGGGDTMLPIVDFINNNFNIEEI